MGLLDILFGDKARLESDLETLETAKGKLEDIYEEVKGMYSSTDTSKGNIDIKGSNATLINGMLSNWDSEISGIAREIYNMIDKIDSEMGWKRAAIVVKEAAILKEEARELNGGIPVGSGPKQ